METLVKRKSNAGRKGLYKEWLKEENLILIQGWARDGLADKQIAHNIGITISTFYAWKNEYKEFSDAVKSGKEVIDRMVENSLLKSALGYEYREEIITKDGIQTVAKVQHPSQTAQIFWLKNRKPQLWRDRQELNVTNTLIELTPEERRKRIKELKNKLHID